MTRTTKLIIIFVLVASLLAGAMVAKASTNALGGLVLLGQTRNYTTEIGELWSIQLESFWDVGGITKCYACYHRIGDEFTGCRYEFYDLNVIYPETYGGSWVPRPRVICTTSEAISYPYFQIHSLTKADGFVYYFRQFLPLQFNSGPMYDPPLPTATPTPTPTPNPYP